MADIDQLLDEFEAIPSRRKKNVEEIPSRRQNDCEGDEIDALLQELQVPKAHSTTRNSIESKKKKCFQVILGEGGCNKLRCLKCDFECLSFPNAEWNGVDYLFFRNYMPNRSQLEKKLKNSPKMISYCCQCSWKSLISSNSTDIKSTNFRWVCGGH